MKWWKYFAVYFQAQQAVMKPYTQSDVAEVSFEILIMGSESITTPVSTIND